MDHVLSVALVNVLQSAGSYKDTGLICNVCFFCGGSIAITAGFAHQGDFTERVISFCVLSCAGS